jgi:hypothetical protein
MDLVEGASSVAAHYNARWAPLSLVPASGKNAFARPMLRSLLPHNSAADATLLNVATDLAPLAGSSWCADTHGDAGERTAGEVMDFAHYRPQQSR